MQRGKFLNVMVFISVLLFVAFILFVAHNDPLSKKNDCTNYLPFKDTTSTCPYGGTLVIKSHVAVCECPNTPVKVIE